MSLTWNEQAPPETRLRRLRLEDAPRAAALANSVGWPHTVQDWERLITWGGRGSFCIVQGDTLLATAISTGYGKDRAWIGVVITHPDHRRRGLGRRVTQAAIDYAQEQGVRCILLDASDMGRPVYERMGFRALYSIEVWEGRASTYLGPQARPLREADLPAVIALDAQAFGVARGRIITRLVQDFPHYAWVDEENGRVAGFILAQLRGNDTAHIGPWVHRSFWGAERLLRTALGRLQGRQVRVDIPDRNAQATVFAHNHNLRYTRCCTRMIYGAGEPPQENLEMYFGVASPATG